jgi:hypothetical protein
MALADHVRVNYGCGYLYMRNAAGANVRVAEARGITLDIDQTLVPYEGAKKFPLGFGVAKCTAKGKISSLVFDVDAMGMLLGDASAATSLAFATETVTVPSHELANAAELDEIWRVLAADGTSLTLIEGAVSATGYYAESAGTITTNAQEPAGVICEYTYDVADGTTHTLSNAAQSSAPMFRVIAWNENNGQQHGLDLLNVAIPKLSTSMLIGETSPTELEFECAVNASGELLKRYVK